MSRKTLSLRFFKCVNPYLYVSFVRTFVSIHALHSGLVALHHVDPEEWAPSHGVLHAGVVRWQIHPANDEQPVHLNETYFEEFTCTT